MPHINIEIKARCTKEDHEKIRQILAVHHADYKGTDHQIDSYFNVPHGRLKLREGDIENHLIHYQRSDQVEPKQSDVILFKSDPNSSLKALLTSALDLFVVVDKQREIYFIDNVKFHLDQVKGLGTFVEIEAIDYDGSIGKEKLQEQCNTFLNLFAISEKNLISSSYSDLILM